MQGNSTLKLNSGLPPFTTKALNLPLLGTRIKFVDQEMLLIVLCKMTVAVSQSQIPP